MDWDDLDLFGLLSDAGASSEAAIYTYPQHIALVTAVAARLGMDRARAAHIFNVDEGVLLAVGNAGATAEEGGETDDECERYVIGDGPNTNDASNDTAPPPPAITDALGRVVNPPVCAHLSREAAPSFLRDPASIPTVVCRAESEAADPADSACRHAAPHTHCLHCLDESSARHPPPKSSGGAGGGGRSLVAHPVPVVELRWTWVEHVAQHRRRSQKLLSMLEGTTIAYLGDSDGDDALDLESDVGIDECEALAAAEARHCCLLVSAGTAARPLLVAYCAECDQFAPLTTFEWRGGDGSGGLALLDGDSNKPVRGAAAAGWEGWVSKDDGLTVMARLLLACNLLVEGEQQQQQRRRGQTALPPHGESVHGEGDAGYEGPWSADLASLSGPRWVFLYKPAFFDMDLEGTLVDQFEFGVELTHGSALLPAARVVGDPPDPQLLLLSEDRAFAAPLLCSAGMAPPYTYAEAVEGFLMDFETPKLAEEKVAFVCRHDNRYRRAVRLVFVEDTQSWECAIVVFHYRQGEEEEAEEEATNRDGRERRHQLKRYEDPTDITQSIRMKADYTISKSLPAALWRQYNAFSAEEHDAIITTGRHPHACTAVVQRGDDPSVNDGMADGLPFSLESRTLSFLASMTAIGQVIVEAVAHFSGR